MRSKKATKPDTAPAAEAMKSVDVADIPVRELMGHPVLTVGLDTSLSDALRVFAVYGVRHLVVVDGAGRCAGLLTDRAVASHWAGHPLAFERFYVSAVYAREAACVRPDTKLAAAATAMREVGIDAVVVANDAREPVGIVTATDLIAAVAAPAGSGDTPISRAATRPKGLN